MSDTPRTAAEFAKKRTFPAGFAELYDFAHQLELKRNEAMDEIKQLKACAKTVDAITSHQVSTIAKERDEYRARCHAAIQQAAEQSVQLHQALAQVETLKSEVEKAYFEAKSDAHLTVERHFATSRAWRVAAGRGDPGEPLTPALSPCPTKGEGEEAARQRGPGE